MVHTYCIQPIRNNCLFFSQYYLNQLAEGAIEMVYINNSYSVFDAVNGVQNILFVVISV